MHVFILISLISGKVVLNFECELVPKYFQPKIQLLMIEERIIIFGVTVKSTIPHYFRNLAVTKAKPVFNQKRLETQPIWYFSIILLSKNHIEFY